MTYFTHIITVPALLNLNDYRWPGLAGGRTNYGVQTQKVPIWENHLENDPAEMTIVYVEGEAMAQALAAHLTSAHPGKSVFLSAIQSVYTRPVSPEVRCTNISKKGVLPS